MNARERESARQGNWAEEHVADLHDLDHAPDEADWWDCINPRTGTKVEVKSTHVHLDDGATGRYRLWEDQHVSLVASDRTGTAWYAFVLLDPSGGVVDVQRRRPATVTRLVRADGGDWNLAGHSERPGRQHKLSWRDVHDDVDQ